ncbi:MAG: VOC family protein [Alphaproteobacteria bacterium]|nr:VOC family protein [Alphaproteobacteria bacterium]
MTASPIHPREIDHVVLRVRDIERMRRFYCEILGCRVEREQAKIGLTQLRAGRSLIDLLVVSGSPGAEGRNMDHVCLRIEPFDAAAISAFLKANGVDPGEVALRYGAEGSGPSLYLADPEGNTVELKGPPAG